MNDKKESVGVQKEQIIQNNAGEEVNRISFVNLPLSERSQERKNSSAVVLKEKECMYWDQDHYEKTFCNENLDGKKLIAYQEESGNLKKILRPDTLTVDNALGKFWYLKSNHIVEFFTNHGAHPENGKTLKEATKYMITKYGKQKNPE